MAEQKRMILAVLKTVMIIGTAVFIFILGTLTTLSAATMQAEDKVPHLVSYQGYLTNDDGQPLEGTVTLTFAIYPTLTEGTALWSETQTNVLVNDGYFTVMLGSETPLSAATFSDPTRYLQIGVDGDKGFVDLPRQQFTAVPYAFQAQQAAVVPWHGLTDVPAGFADGVDDTAHYANRIVVAKSGGDFSSVQAAIDSVTNATAESPYVVWVAPGTYSETVTMKPYVHLYGAGQEATRITSNVSSEPDPAYYLPVSPTAGTLLLAANSTLRDLTVVNTGSEMFNVALWSLDGTAAATVANVTTQAVGGGIDNYAISLNGSRTNVTLKDVTALSENGGSSNVAVNIVGATATLHDGSFTARGGDNLAIGIHNWQNATLVADDVFALAEMAPGYGLRNAGSTATLHGGSFTGTDTGIYNDLATNGIPSIVFAENITAQGESGLSNLGEATLHGGSFTTNAASDGRGITNSYPGTLEANNIFAVAEGDFATGLVNDGGVTIYGGTFAGRGDNSIGIRSHSSHSEWSTVTHAVVEGSYASVLGDYINLSHTQVVDETVIGGFCTAVSYNRHFYASSCP